MQRRLGQRHTSDMVLLAGWLFADLLLGLMVIFLVSAPGAIPKSLICSLTPTAAAALHNSLGKPQTGLSPEGKSGPFVVAEAPALSTPTPRSDINCPTPTPTSTATLTPTPNKSAISKTPQPFTFHTNADALLNGDPTEKARLQGIIQQQLGAVFSPDD
ncbi:MAG TPA: hypothetical protein VFV38_14275, partial [Ktedonobacteraceae bacterium]|nr:hypothetical protein [Ktedonobacteraceae bacterium]